MNELIGDCGLDCGQCDAMTAPFMDNEVARKNMNL